MDEPRVTMAHIRQLRYCAHGARAWCARYGLDFRVLAREGLPASEVAATGDAFGLAAAELARKEAC